MKVSEVLSKAKELIKDPANWIQGDYAGPDNCFCALGAIGKVSMTDDDGVTWFGEASSTPAGKLLRKVVDRDVTEAGYSESTTFAVFNDNYTHAQVMEAFDKAIYTALVQEGEVVKL